MAVVWRYGLYPQQVQGVNETGRPFYFRAREATGSYGAVPLSPSRTT